MRILPFGDRALLAEVDALADVLALHRALEASRPAGVVDLVPAARTVLVHVDPAVLALPAAHAWIAGGGSGAVAAPADAGGERVLPVAYDGADLTETAELLGIGAGELVARHLAATWTVAFSGFAPGFGYLVSADWPFDVPRLPSPRTAVPAGAVGLAGTFSGAYPRSSPGGWRLIGATTAPLFDPAAERPALLHPGDRVRFTASPAPVEAATPPPVPSGEGAFTVLAPGALATVQDAGRPGHLAAGVARSGAADRGALRTANRLVGNAADAAGVELVLGGFRAVAAHDLWIAVTGAWGPLRIGGRPVDPYLPVRWPAGAELEAAPFVRGIRAFLAVRGGIAATRLWGSAATDTLAGLGPRPLAAGDALCLGDAAERPVPALDAFPWTPPATELRIPLAPGPRADWFTRTSLDALFDSWWTVSPQSDRVGVRLTGPVLTRTVAGELASEGMLPGAVQVPPSGHPVILGPDGPVTGGYPVIAVVTDAGRDALAQARPGSRVRFHRA